MPSAPCRISPLERGSCSGIVWETILSMVTEPIVRDHSKNCFEQSEAIADCLLA
jgi:hypothetical protein